MLFSKKAPKQKDGCLDTLDTPPPWILGVIMHRCRHGKAPQYLAVHGPMVWNSLSDDLCAQQDYESDKQLSYRRGTARCVVSIEILPIATQQCRNYLYDKS